MMRDQQDQQQSKLLYELSSLVLTILQSPHLSFSSPSSSSRLVSSRRSQPQPQSVNLMNQVSPAGFASLLLGVSLALMLCGSVTFVIGFILMPWVLGLVMVLYFVGIVSNLSYLGRTILYPYHPANASTTSSSPSQIGPATSPKQISEMCCKP